MTRSKRKGKLAEQSKLNPRAAVYNNIATTTSTTPRSGTPLDPERFAQLDLNEYQNMDPNYRQFSSSSHPAYPRPHPQDVQYPQYMSAGIGTFPRNYLPQPSTSGIMDTSRGYSTTAHPQYNSSSPSFSAFRDPLQNRRSPSKPPSPRPLTPKRTPNKDSKSSKVSRTETGHIIPCAASGGVPDPTPAYLEKSAMPFTVLEQPQHLLVVIDLNGTLLHRPTRHKPTKFTSRPHTERFLHYCISTFTVVFWSSARAENVLPMVNTLLAPQQRAQVAAIWGRDKFNLAASDYNEKVQCFKRLTTVWKDPIVKSRHPEFNSGGKWDQTNTVLIDDSLFKGRSEPYNLIQIPEFNGKEEDGDEILPQVHDYLNSLSLCSNVSSYAKVLPFKARGKKGVISGPTDR